MGHYHFTILDWVVICMMAVAIGGFGVEIWRQCREIHRTIVSTKPKEAGDEPGGDA